MNDKFTKKYPIITLCGSTKFKNEFLQAQKELTLQGCIVLSVGLFGHSGDYEAWDNKDMLDDMHKQKIDMSDAIMVIDVNNYIGTSTQNEIQYAKSKGKSIYFYNQYKGVNSMDDKTLKIIAVCKGWGNYTYPTSLETLVHFFSDLYGHPVHFYTYKEVEKIMRRAFYDFIDHCDVPSDFLRQMYEWDFKPDYTLVERIYGAFSVVPVYSGSVNPQFVNGFDERFNIICDELDSRC